MVAKTRVLLIEDDDDLRETTLEFLTDEGFDIAPASDGAKGIQMAIANPPDVIVCDINLPDIGGYEVYSTLSQIPTISLIPFIFLSAKSSSEEILLGIHLGVDDYITKPFEMSELMSIIKKRVASRNRLLAHSDEKFNLLLDSTQGCACILGKDTVIVANRAMECLLGYSSGELNGIPLNRIVNQASHKEMLEKVAQCLNQAKKSFRTSFIANCKNSSTVQLFAEGNLITEKGERRIMCTLGQEMVEHRSTSKVKAKAKLSQREVEVLGYICEGLSNSEIGEKLYISERTVEGHRARLFGKTDTKNAVSLAMWAVKNGYTIP